MRGKKFILSTALICLLAVTLSLTARAQDQIVLGDSYQGFQFTSSGNGSVQLACGCSVNGSAYATGSLTSTGQYTLNAAGALNLTVTSDGSFIVSQSSPWLFTYTSSQGDLTGQITFLSLEQAALSTNAVLEGEMTITGGSFATSLANTEANISFLIPVGGSLGSLDTSAGSISAQIGYPSTITLSPEEAESCPVCRDFVTGGGWIIAPDGAKANFGVHGGIRNGGFWGHLEYNDHGSTPPMMVKSESITNYLVLSPTQREIQGTASVNGQSGYTFTVIVTDDDSNGGRQGGVDSFAIQLSNGYVASGKMGGGNIEIHKARGKCKNDLEKDHDADARFPQHHGSEHLERR